MAHRRPNSWMPNMARLAVCGGWLGLSCLESKWDSDSAAELLDGSMHLGCDDVGLMADFVGDEAAG